MLFEAHAVVVLAVAITAGLAQLGTIFGVVGAVFILLAIAMIDC